ncbi:MAG: hypothetical protein ACUVUD_02115 [bacterium]
MKLFLMVSFLTLPAWADSNQSVNVIDEGEGEYRFEVTPPSVDTIKGGGKLKGLQEGFFFEENGAGIGYLRVLVDTFPVELFLDGKKMMMNSSVQEFPLFQGKHFVSLFSPKQVYLSFREETPGVFWQKIMPAGLGSYRFGLISSYEREAVRTGTKWMQVTPDDTQTVELSSLEVRRIYYRHAKTAAITFFSVATVIAAAMFGSAALLAGEEK